MNKTMEILNKEKFILTETIERINNFQRTIPIEDTRLRQVFKLNNFDFTSIPVPLKDVVFGEKYMYCSWGKNSGIVRALSDEEEYGICVEFIHTGEQDILFTHEKYKKLYRLPMLPQNLRDSINTIHL
jgi:hypothetical protein